MVGPTESPGNDTDADTPSASVQIAPSNQNDDLLSNILTPGSSLNPTFLLVVDGSLALLALTLLSLVVATGGNIHLIALLVIEFALWVSIKWFINELQNTKAVASVTSSQSGSSSETKKNI